MESGTVERQREAQGQLAAKITIAGRDDEVKVAVSFFSVLGDPREGSDTRLIARHGVLCPNYEDAGTEADEIRHSLMVLGITILEGQDEHHG